MKCPYCQTEMGELPIQAVRASMTGHRMLQIFDKIVESGDRGISVSSLVAVLYGDSDTDAFNTLKVTMIRLKERVRKFGWVVESGTAIDSTTERVYRLKREEPVT